MALVLIVTEQEAPLALTAIYASARDDVFTTGRFQLIAQDEARRFVFHPDRVPMAGWHQVPDQSTIFASRQVRGVPVDLLTSRGCLYGPTISPDEWFKARRRERLEARLHDIHLDWRAQVDERFVRYDRRRTNYTVDDWITQFRKLGDEKTGCILARMLNVLDTPRLIAAYDPAQLFAGSQPRILGVASRMGKSGARLSGLLRNFSGAEVYEIAEAIERHATSGSHEPLHVFEDGLWTGIELKRVIDALLGTVPEGKVKALASPDLIQTIDIRIHYLVQTDLGVYAARNMLFQRGLTRIQIAQSPAVRTTNVLSPNALDKFESGQYGYDHVEQYRLTEGSDISPSIQSFKGPWCSEADRHRALEFLRGHNSLYTNNMDGADGRVECRLPFGTSHIGSLEIFSHSAPRAALPVYWCDGTIHHGKGRRLWTALVPEVALMDIDAE